MCQVCVQRENAYSISFTCIYPFNPHNNSVQLVLSPCCYRVGSRGTEVQNLFKVTGQQVFEIQIHVVWFQSLSFNYCTVLLLFNLG